MSTEQNELIWEGIRFKWGVPVKPGYYLWKPNGQYSTPFPVSCADLKSWHGTTGWWCELVPKADTEEKP
jgi:hypothetical protein